MSRIAVIQYPGTNCEHETAATVRAAGMDADVFRWNRDPAALAEYDGFVLPGGFSYQDRVRAGAVAAKKAVGSTLVTEAAKGKPVLGICNGAQILLETGLVPGLERGRIEMALAPNSVRNFSGYYCRWVFLKHSPSPARRAFSGLLEDGEVIPVPVAHAEGCFTTTSKQVATALTDSHLIGFQYCSAAGEIIDDFPVNPNGSLMNIAGLYNRDGNVLALMPHPERAAWMRQIPSSLPGDYGRIRRDAAGDLTALRADGPGMKLFKSMKKYIED